MLRFSLQFFDKNIIVHFGKLIKRYIKIIEVQTGPILKETDIVRFQDVYGRIK